nr:probable bifunctional methylthioribulose-1-phosphate dehydratase/enolase-phosphatase E1 1 [Ipomoea trifida]
MRLRHFELRLISAPLPLPRHDATVHHCHQLPSLRLPLNPPQSPVVSPLRLHQSPPSSRRLASATMTKIIKEMLPPDWCFSLNHIEKLLIFLHSTKASAKEGSVASNGGIGPSRRHIVLDIEGTTTPISFVSDVLFPYGLDNVGRHLDITYNTAETQDDIKLLRAQVEEDLQNGVAGAVPIRHDDAGKEEVIAALVTNVEAMIKVDRKITSLKQLQVHIWRTGFQHNKLEAIVYDDVPEALEKWNALGIKVYIYSSGSRLAQRLLFSNTNHGDLRNFLCGFFDTTVGCLSRSNCSFGSIYEEKFEQAIQSPGPMLLEIEEGDTKAIVAYLNVLQKVVENANPIE